MARYLLEIPHESDKIACTRAVQLLLSSGSHFLSNADWGCADDDHRAWLVVDVESREEAVAILPPALRPTAHIVRLIKFDLNPANRHVSPRSE